MGVVSFLFITAFVFMYDQCIRIVQAAPYDYYAPKDCYDGLLYGYVLKFCYKLGTYYYNDDHTIIPNGYSTGIDRLIKYSNQYTTPDCSGPPDRTFTVEYPSDCIAGSSYSASIVNGLPTNGGDSGGNLFL